MEYLCLYVLVCLGYAYRKFKADIQFAELIATVPAGDLQYHAPVEVTIPRVFALSNLFYKAFLFAYMCKQC